MALDTTDHPPLLDIHLNYFSITLIASELLLFHLLHTVQCLFMSKCSLGFFLYPAPHLILYTFLGHFCFLLKLQQHLCSGKPRTSICSLDLFGAPGLHFHSLLVLPTSTSRGTLKAECQLLLNPSLSKRHQFQ